MTDQADRLPYEQARDELTDVVKRLEAGGLTLEQSLDLWERGERLAAICEEWLEGARARLAAAAADRKADQGDPPRLSSVNQGPVNVFAPRAGQKHSLITGIHR